MNKAYIYHAIVSGPGQFPYDMLRYDECFPRTEGDVGVMAGESGQRSISITRVSTLRHRTFTEKRWESFGWHVESIEEEGR